MNNFVAAIFQTKEASKNRPFLATVEEFLTVYKKTKKSNVFNKLTTSSRVLAAGSKRECSMNRLSIIENVVQQTINTLVVDIL